jgi:hypothetical protein
MADTGYSWGSWAYVQKAGAGGDWNNVAINDDAGQLSDAIALTGKAACIISIQAVEDNTGTINGVCTVAVLADTDGTNYEDPPGLAGAQVGSPYKFTFTPVQNDTVYLTFAIDPKYFASPKIYILNEGGQQLVTDVRYKTATIPAAS